MSIIIGAAYYCVTPVIDIMVFEAVNMDKIWFVRLFFIITAALFSASLYAMAYSCAQLYSAAHAPYKPLNAIIAKKEMIMLPSQRRKIAFYIERFSGPAIATYIFDFFPLNNYEFYLFVTAVCTNYFLINDFVG